MILDLVMFKKMVTIFFLLTFALVTGKVSNIFVLTFVPITDKRAISMFSN